MTRVLTLKARASRARACGRASASRSSARNAASGTRSSAATALHQTSSRRNPGRGAASLFEKRRGPEPEMRKLVGESEHLRRLGVRAVDEDQRREGVTESESAKLGGVEAAVVVAHHHPADHDEHAGGVGLADEEAERIGPCRARAAGGQIEA